MMWLQMWFGSVRLASPRHLAGTANEKRDRQAQLKLYSRRGVNEYWIIDWLRRRVEVFRRKNAQLELIATLAEPDTLTTPLLPKIQKSHGLNGFSGFQSVKSAQSVAKN